MSLLRWGWVFLERTRILSRIQFTTHVIEFFVVELIQFVGSTLNVMLTRQTCGQRLSKAAESKHRALGNYFSEQICYVFLTLKCRGDWDLGLCFWTWRTAAQWQNPIFPASKHVFPPGGATALLFSKRKSISFVSTWMPISSTFWYWEHIANSLWEIIFQRLAFAFRSLARALAAGLPCQDHVYSTTDKSFRFHNRNFDEMRRKLDSTENPCSFEKYPTPP